MNYGHSLAGFSKESYMSNELEMVLSHNELLSIANALETQILMCEDTIMNPLETFDEKAAAHQAKRVSESALKKIEHALKR